MVIRSTSELMNLVDENNVEAARKFFHPEYMCVRGLQMLGLERLIANLEDFADVCSSTNQIRHFGDERSNVFSHDITYNEAIRGFQKGESVNVRLVSLKKGGLLWRALISTSLQSKKETPISVAIEVFGKVMADFIWLLKTQKLGAILFFVLVLGLAVFYILKLIFLLSR